MHPEPISPREWRRVTIYGVLLMALTTLPYILGWLSAGKDWQFGGFLFGVDDGYSYLAKMRLGARGDWLFTIRYTSEPHSGQLFFLPYILLGKLTAFLVDPHSTHLTPAMAVVFHFARFLFGILLITVYYRFVAIFLRARASRMLALVLITLGGGFGWLLSLIGLGHWLGSLPVDFIVPEGYSFLILFGLPHLALARCGLLSGLILLFRALDNDSPRGWPLQTLFAGLCWLVMGLCVPFYIPGLYLLLGFWGLASWIRARRFPWRLFWRAASAAAVPLPLLIYTLVVFQSEPVFKQWSAQNQLPSPHPMHYLVGYCALTLPALAAVRWAWCKGKMQLPYLLLVIWIAVVPALVYLPINVQRRLAEGVIVPLGILAAAGLRLALRRRGAYRRARTALLVAALGTSLLLWLGGLFSALKPDRPLFRPQAELQALDRLNAYATPDAVVLSSKKTGNYLAAHTDLIAYVGHGPETLHAEDKKRKAERFFAGELSDQERHTLLQQIDFVFYGPLEYSDNNAWADGLRLLPGFDPDDSYVVYEVIHDET